MVKIESTATFLATSSSSIFRRHSYDARSGFSLNLRPFVTLGCKSGRKDRKRRRRRWRRKVRRRRRRRRRVRNRRRRRRETFKSGEQGGKEELGQGERGVEGRE